MFANEQSGRGGGAGDWRDVSALARGREMWSGNPPGPIDCGAPR
jgi:hypothetical protein